MFQETDFEPHLKMKDKCHYGREEEKKGGDNSIGQKWHCTYL